MTLFAYLPAYLRTSVARLHFTLKFNSVRQARIKAVTHTQLEMQHHNADKIHMDNTHRRGALKWAFLCYLNSIGAADALLTPSTFDKPVH